MKKIHSNYNYHSSFIIHHSTRMELTVLLAKIIGIFYLVVGLGLLLNQKMYRHVVEQIHTDTASRFIAGLVGLVMGLLIVLQHNVWELSAAGLVTLIGWIATLKSAFVIVFPQSFEAASKRLVASKQFWIAPLVALLIGVYLIYIGFFA